MRKTFVLDTNVLLHDPQALTRFEDNAVVIPIEVVEKSIASRRTPPRRAATRVRSRVSWIPTREGKPGGVPIDGSSGGTLQVVLHPARPWRSCRPS